MPFDHSPLADNQIFDMDWSQYCKQVKREARQESQDWGYDTLRKRFDALEKADELFDKRGNFHRIHPDWQRRIAGFKNIYGNIEWHWFGNMGGARLFKHEIADNNRKISRALDHIPHTGEVTRKQFKSFVDLFCSAFDPPAKNPRATATRLLVYKRPDYFVSLNDGSEDRLNFEFCSDKYGDINLHNYWRRVVEPILDTEWWQSPKPKGGLDESIWWYRAAILDVRFYSYEKEEIERRHHARGVSEALRILSTPRRR